MLALVIASTLAVLFLMTGSLVLGVKAVLMNALSLSAVFGILVLIFQHGSLQGLLSYRSTGALDATQPILLFAIAFGLATDYGVFLISRIKEAHDSGMPDNRAVAIGIERTGRIQTVRGCPKHCSFCSVWRTDGQEPRQAAVDAVIQEAVGLAGEGSGSSRSPTTISIP